MTKSFSHKIKVYYEDTDAGGIVYYANYLKYLERARTEALVNIGYSNQKIKEDFKIAQLPIMLSIINTICEEKLLNINWKHFKKN